MSTLVLGSGGQLARYLRETLQDAIFWGRGEQSLEHPGAAEAAIVKHAPAVIVNAAAYTAVDEAEAEPDLAWAINAEGAAAAARAAATLAVPLVHVSTDYVFNGARDRPYRPRDETSPINVYGRTKLAGELAVITLCHQYWIVRASWVFSEFDGNFVTTILRLATERDRLRVVADQRGRPTFAGDLARAVAALATGQTQKAVPWGIHHLSGGTPATRHQFAERIIESGYTHGLLERQPEVEPVPTDEYPARALRPINAILEQSPLLHAALRFEPHWEAGLEKVLARRKLKQSA